MQQNNLKPAELRVAALLHVLVAMLMVIGGFALVRVVFIAKFASLDVFADNADCIPLFLLNALRFDAQIAAYAAIPVLVAAVAVCVSPLRFSHGAERFCHVYVSVVTSLAGLLGLCDVHYYNNFSRHFDIVAFDFFDEDPQVLIKGVINEAPVIPILIGLAVVFAFAWFAGRWMLGRADRLAGRVRLWVAAVIVVVITGVSLRGSLGTFTLRAEDVYVSSSPMMNDCVPNCVFMLKKAWSEKKKQFKMESDEDILRAAGFASEHEAAAAWLGVGDSPSLSADSSIVARTPKKPLREGYDVVLIVCESWGHKLMAYDSIYSMDLLCSMRQHLAEDPVWLNFLSATNGTIDAVEALTTSCPYPRLFTSRYRNLDLPYSSARVWHDAGYSTHFVSGIEISWRNLIDVLPHQGFDDVTGKFEILKEEPGAELNHTWGVYDHSMLNFLLSKINSPSADGKPRFFMALTSTNHTPFEFPADYALPEINIPSDPAAFAIEDRSVIYDYLRGYQYTSRALGDFMTALKASPAGRHTIVAITGDHNTRLVLPYPEGEDEMWKYSVPFYLYVPDAPEQWHDFARRRYGSHEDIIPTLANLTLADAAYLSTGQNLLADSIPGGTFGVNVSHELFSPDADPVALKRRLQALDALKKIWFKRQFEGMGAKP